MENLACQTIKNQVTDLDQRFSDFNDQVTALLNELQHELDDLKLEIQQLKAGVKNEES